MSKLIDELQRLYFFDDQDGAALSTPELIAKSHVGECSVALKLVRADGLVRTMVVGFEKAVDWECAAQLYLGIQEDLELPAPAISVSGLAGFQLWISLAEGVPFETARIFLDALRCKYLAELSLSSLRLMPNQDRDSVNLVPALHETTGKWSAFIDPSMGAMFNQESGLDMAPNMDRQAEMLSRLLSVKAGDFQRALGVLQEEAEANLRLQEEAAAEQRENARQSAGIAQTTSKLTVGENFTDPKMFLLAVMNDGSVSAEHRIKAATALLPYFNDSEPQ